MIKRTTKHGHSTAVVLPAAMCHRLRLAPGDEIIVDTVQRFRYGRLDEDIVPTIVIQRLPRKELPN